MIKIKFLARKFTLFCNQYFSPLNTFMRMGKDPEPNPVPDPHPDPYLWLTDPNADLGCPKTYGSYGSGFSVYRNIGHPLRHVLFRRCPLTTPAYRARTRWRTPASPPPSTPSSCSPRSRCTTWPPGRSAPSCPGGSWSGGWRARLPPVSAAVWSRFDRWRGSPCCFQWSAIPSKVGWSAVIRVVNHDPDPYVFWASWMLE